MWIDAELCLSKIFFRLWSVNSIKVRLDTTLLHRHLSYRICFQIRIKNAAGADFVFRWLLVDDSLHKTYVFGDQID
jgi:hypothetical protein